ncbi:hypothetical protein TNCT_548371 [Trichonephila clavata]|uniref:Uncharacterized protein n=1 Tax=Trichonephila clavata TaxID=2740835 RepID=A0A8X6K7Y5_TRICU|nr:hypothetical protein TNCT_548371 [Trichonephila clavata]
MSMTFWVSPEAEAAMFQKAWPSLQVINWVFSCEPQRYFGEIVVELKTQLLLGLTNSSSQVTNDGFSDVLVCSFKKVTSLSWLLANAMNNSVVRGFEDKRSSE